MLIGLNVISGSCISKLIGGKFTSFLHYHFLSMPLFSLRLKTCHFYLTRVKKRSAAKSDENIIVEEERSTKAAEKDTSAIVLASVCLTGATVVGSVNTTEFWQRRIRPPSFYYCSVAKWILQFHSDLLFVLAAK